MKKILFYLLLSSTLVFGAASCEDPIIPDKEEDKNLSGSITEVRTLDATVEYLLVGPLLVEEGGVLNIPAGTTIKAKKGFSSYILVLQGAKATIENALVKGQGQAKDLVDLTDKKGDGQESTTISITNSLSTKISGKEVNGTGNVTVKAGNTGCPTNIFSWTGYTL